MMQSKDLRVGNLILCNDIVSEVIETTWMNCINAYGDDVYFSEDRCKMTEIDITEEWLLKFGFEEKGTIFRINKNTENEFDVFIKLKTKDIYFGGAFISYQIKYVHQLQNLYFSLTGGELELKND